LNLKFNLFKQKKRDSNKKKKKKMFKTLRYPIVPVNDTKKELNDIKKEKKYKLIFEDWMTNTTSHGLPNVIKTKYWFIKIFWLLFYIIAFCYFSYTLVQTWVDYFSYGVLTTLTNVNDEIVDFPAVDFCNLNPTPLDLNRSYTYDLSEYNDSISFYDELIDEIRGYLYISDIVNNVGSTMTFRFNQMIISCYFNGVKCTQDDFYYYRDYDYGSCYKFNGGRIKSLKNITRNGLLNTPYYLEKEVDLKNITDSGASNGLRLEIFVGDPQKVTYSNKNGIKLIVHNSSIDIFPGEQGIEASTGQQTNVAVSRTWTNKLGPPYSNCIRDLNKSIEQYSRESDLKLNSILTRMRDVYNMTIYCQKTCFQICKQDYINKTCGCYDSRLPLPTKEIADFYQQHRVEYNNPFDFFNDSRITTPCVKYSNFNLVDMTCLSNARKSYVKNEMQKCLNKCPLECETVRIEQEISTSDYPSLW
jgi:hypothetical protein